MLLGKTVTCFVPAKGTSQRLPGKNLRLCDGVTLVRRAVDLALECGFFDEIVLSTDSLEVLEASTLELGKDVTWHERPESLSLPTSSVWNAITNFGPPSTDYIVLLHPTSPCLKKRTVGKALAFLINNHERFSTLATVNETTPYSWSAGEMPDFSDSVGTQFMAPRYRLNNAIFAAKWDFLYKIGDGYDSDWIPFLIEKSESVDIDTIDDLMIAEAILQWRRKNE